MDGARLWNASIATGIPLRDYAAPMDSVSLCFSKGLGAPLGSILVADAVTIQRAHRLRKMLGGSMRQTGIVAAAALYAMDHHVGRLREDHDKAQVLGKAVQSAPGLELVHPDDTNNVIIGVQAASDSPEALVADLRQQDDWATVWDARSIRMVTHLDVSAAQIETVAQRLQSIRA
jgi:threonine aldolase